MGLLLVTADQGIGVTSWHCVYLLSLGYGLAAREEIMQAHGYSSPGFGLALTTS